MKKFLFENLNTTYLIAYLITYQILVYCLDIYEFKYQCALIIISCKKAVKT